MIKTAHLNSGNCNDFYSHNLYNFFLKLHNNNKCYYICGEHYFSDMSNSQALKLQLISQIAALDNDATLTQLEKILKDSDVLTVDVLKNLKKKIENKIRFSK